MMPDDSLSIRTAGNVRTVREGHNLTLDALGGSSQAGEVLVHTRYLNGHVLFPYQPLTGAIRMTSQNYKPSLGTPLYDQTAVLLGTVLAKAWEFEDNGVPVRTVTLIITDGDDVCSTRQTPAAVRSIVEDMQRSECHVIAAMGINDGSTDFHTVFRDMGIPDRWILTPGNSATEIRSAFQVFSQSAVLMSQPGGGVSPGGCRRIRELGDPDCRGRIRDGHSPLPRDPSAGKSTARVGRNNQDAHAFSVCDERILALVCDGCGSGRYSEVGAQIGARLLLAALHRRMAGKSRERFEKTLERARRDVLRRLAWARLSNGRATAGGCA